MFERAYPAGWSGVPPTEAFFIAVLLSLSLLAIIVEVLRYAGGQPSTPHRQFWLRMCGGAVLLFLVGLMTFGVVFTRPQDGRIFGWYWAFFSTVLFGMVLILRYDVASSRRRFRDESRRIRDERLDALKQLAEHLKQSQRAQTEIRPSDESGD